MAGAFAFFAFFALFPLIILFVTIASAFIDRDQAGQQVIAYLEAYVPIHGEMQRHIIRTITGVINARGQAGAVALLMLSVGAFGGVIALLLWIDVSGWVIIFGACLCAARSADGLAWVPSSRDPP